MKTQGKKTVCGGSAKTSDLGGKKIATQSGVIQEYASANHAEVYPIDTLLVGQLETLLHEEEALSDRYSRIDASTNSIELRMAFSEEVAELKDRADRLYRLINEMDHYGPYPSSYTHSASIAA